VLIDSLLIICNCLS